MNQTQVNTVTIRDSIDKVTTLLGKPLRESSLENDVVVLTYTSLVPSVSDYVYVKEGKVILVSESFYKESVTIKQLLPQIQRPDATYNKLSGSRKESTQTFFSVWFKEGLAVETETNDSDAKVLRSLRFLPMEENAFFSLWPQSSSLNRASVPLVMQQETTFSSQLQNALKSNYIKTGVVIVVIVALFLFLVVTLKMKSRFASAS